MGEGSILEQSFQVDPSTKEIFLLGTSRDGPAAIKISKSLDNGLSWDKTTVLHGEIEIVPTKQTDTKFNFKWLYLPGNGETASPLFRWGVDYQAVCVYAKQLPI